MDHANNMYSLACELFPINRSLTGEGVRKTLDVIKRELPNLHVGEFKTGEQVFDWSVPKEWSIKQAYVQDLETGEVFIDFSGLNLHVMGYSVPVDQVMTIEQLDSNLYSLPNQPDAVPYVTSYYKERWGFCITHNQRKELLKNSKRKVRVKIESELFDGVMNYGELLIQGSSKEEVLLSTYICHPSMANNELSGPVLAVELAKLIQNMKDLRYTYRILFLPETIGSIAYLSKNFKVMRDRTKAGFVLTCVGDNNSYSFMPSKYNNTYADRVAEYVMKITSTKYTKYSFVERGSDERQYSSPGIELPVVSIMRSKYAEYDEYHTSLDNLSYISPDGLYGSYDKYKKCIEILETDYQYRCNVMCEPQLGKRNLYPTVSTKNTVSQVKVLRDVLMYSDGSNSLLDIADITSHNYFDIRDIANKLRENELISRVDND
ncbi:DUF4910 domain-containing protein [Salinivibrio kushneri]|uniref:DUF4910 domain-containing protein n=1 Tax=Salinivibrio kushneri TaxID=1908198 RepID=A0AA47KJA4_9GAMM|nr:DUF4910 domain-containing protein [Salinivibrio kushneri]WBA07882.1 DUF4910 domain-containing protein [Salinivibrio kushneri]